ncbi:MAG: beta-lactamase family protein [Acidobacteria bacterium]|nr:beta-lactamase family protein [Acidobacteriota bacterium]
MFRLVSFVVTVLLVGAPAYAQDKTGEIDKIFSWATPATPGCAVAVSQHGKLLVNRAYGSADLERDVPLSPSSTFDAGSLRKQFVAAAVLLLVEEKRLSLSDDVRKYVPKLPDYGHKITLDHLLTHTSGLRDWTGMLPLATGNPDALTMILRQRGLNFAPGEEWSYSNSGYVLLTEIVSRASGMPFSEFTRKRLFEPLGMKTTTYVDDLRTVVKNRALAYEKEGNRWRLDMLLGNDRGGGGALFSTAGDLINWNDALTSGRLGAFVTEKLQEQARLNNGRKLKYARGLIMDSYRGGTLVSHSGGAAGYSAWLGRLPAQGLSVSVLCNADETSATALARRVADQFLPAAGAETAEVRAPAAVAEGAAVTGVDLNGKAGLFVSERTGDPLRLIINNGKLQIPGGPPLMAVTNDRFRNPRGDLFFMSQDEFELHFLSPEQFELKSMEGHTTRYRRAQPYTPAIADLQAFTGRYESDELRAVFEMAPGKDSLMIRLNDSPAPGFEFRPVYRDTFQLGRVTLRFVRDKAGKVVTLDYSNPLIRNLKFTRLSDRTSSR